MIKDEVNALKDEVISLRRDFHQHPELGTHEYRTAMKVEEYLNALGIQTERKFNTGVVGCLNGAEQGKTLLLRADMDALPLQEENDVPYRSQSDGVMHACGHDGHTAMLLCAAKILSKHRNDFRGTIKFVFQPNEEDSGAGPMVAEGVLERPKVDASFALHLWSPLPVGTIGLSAGPFMAEMYNFKIVLKGKSAHSSTPQDGIDPILCAANIIQSVQMIQTREVPPMDATCIAFGIIRGGTATNIIADKVELEGCIRYLYDGCDNSPQRPLKRFRRIVENIAAAHGVICELTFSVSNYALINDEGIVEFLKERVFSKIVDPANIVPYRTMGGEDFSEFGLHNGVPGALAMIGVGNPEKGTSFPHHSARFNIDEDQLTVGVEAFVRMALEYLA